MNATLVDALRALLPARLQKAQVIRPRRLVLELYVHVSGAGVKRWLDVDVDRNDGAFSLDDAKTARGSDDDTPPAFQGLARKELFPGAITALDSGDTCDTLTIARADGKARLLVVERDRVVLCAVVDEGRRVLGVLGDANARDGRDLRRGKLYEPPRDVTPAARATGATGATDATGATSSDAAHASKPRAPHDPLAELRARVRAEKKRLQRLVDALGRDVDKHGDPAAHEKNGELLKTVLAQVRRGEESAHVVDWNGEARVLALDPAIDPKANLERFFKRAKKARLARDKIGPRLDETKRALARIEDVATKLHAKDAGDDVVDAARALLARPDAGGSARRRAAKAGKRQPWRAFKCTGDVVVRVGRGPKDNDALVKSARGNDVWLHARDQAGAHVVVPASGVVDVDPELLLDAAHLAAHFSAARTEARVDVQHTRVKHVKKPGAGAPAGFVHVSNESVLHLRVDAARIARILANEVPAT